MYVRVLSTVSTYADSETPTCSMTYMCTPCSLQAFPQAGTDSVTAVSNCLAPNEYG